MIDADRKTPSRQTIGHADREQEVSRLRSALSASAFVVRDVAGPRSVLHGFDLPQRGRTQVSRPRARRIYLGA